jgi:hypothetical protein
MTLSTKDLGKNKPNKALESREKIKKLKEKHIPLFKKEGVSNPKFIPRMAYKHNGELIIGFYERDVYGGVDIYTEFVSRDYTPEDNQRRLYKWLYNAEYATEYPLSDPHAATGDRRYLIPVEELICVADFHKEKDIRETEEENDEVPFEAMPDPGSDVPYADMTLRDFCAIEWKQPVSQKKWLNTLITNTFNK